MCDVSDFNDESRWLDMTHLKEEYDNILIETFFSIHLPFRIALIIGGGVMVICLPSIFMNHAASFVWMPRDFQ
jgi:hypothetical protein